MSLRIRRGTEAQRTALTFDLGEVVYTTDTKKLYIGDGVTVGGTNVLANMAGTGVTYNSTTQQLDFSANGITTNNISEGNNNKYFTNQRAQDAFGSLLTNGVQTGLSITYDAVNHALNVAVNDIASVSQDPAPSLGGNLTLNSRNIIGTGNINITGSITSSGTITTTATTASTSTTTGALIVGGGAGVAGNLNVGGTVATNSISGGLNVIGVSANTTTPLSITGIGDGTYTNTVFMSLRVAKGTIATPTTTAANDVLGGYNILGYNGSTYKAAAFLGATWDSTAVLTDVYPASIVTLQGSGGGSIQNKAILDAAGRWNAPRLKVTSYATGSYPTSPQAGEVIFDSTTKHFMGHNGTAWVAFTGP